MSNLFRVGLENAVAASLLALVAFAASRFLKRSPALVHAFLLLVLLKLVTPPLWSFPVVVGLALSETEACAIVDALPEPIKVDFADSTTPETSGIEPEVIESVAFLPPYSVVMEPEPELDLALVTMDDSEPTEVASPPLTTVRATEVLAGIWLVGSVVTLVFSIRAIRRFVRVLVLAKPASSAVGDQVEEAAARIGLARVPETFLINWDRPPMVWALGPRPCLMIPVALWSRLDAGQRDTLLIHELAHLKRGDHLVRWLELAVSVLFWWLPVVWWTRRALRETEEDCCDAWVIWALPKSARCYADTLVETVDFLSESRTQAPLLASGFGHVRHLKRRLTMIMRGNARRRLGLREGLAILAMGAAFLPLNPSWAELQDPPKPAEPVATTSNVEVKEDRTEQGGTVTVTRTITTDVDEDGELDVVVTGTGEPTAALPAVPAPPAAPDAPVPAIAPVPPVPPVPPSANAPATVRFFATEAKTLRGTPVAVPAAVAVTATALSADDVMSSTVKSLKKQLKQLTENPEDDKERNEKRVKAIKQAIEALQGALPEPKESRNDRKRARVVIERRIGKPATSTATAKDIHADGDVVMEVRDVEVLTDDVRGPEIAQDSHEAVNQQIQAVREKLQAARRVARAAGTDPTVRALEQKLNQLVDETTSRRIRMLAESDKLKQQEDRLSAMEKSLEKVLTELKSLKKQKSD